jgi:hypothetical protein
MATRIIYNDPHGGATDLAVGESVEEVAEEINHVLRNDHGEWVVLTKEDGRKFAIPGNSIISVGDHE